MPAFPQPGVRGFDFGRHARLDQKAQFDRVFGSPSIRLTRYPLRLTGAPNTSCDGAGARLGIVVAKRVVRRAVDRNRAKRVIRESFRIARGRLPDLDIIVQVFASPHLAGQRADSNDRSSRFSNSVLTDALEGLWAELSMVG